MQPQTLRRIFFLFGGLGLIGIGVPMLILPGPGLLTIIAGFALIGKGLKGERN